MFKRIILISVSIAMLFCSCLGRTYYISSNNAYKVADTYNSININISKLYTNIYTREGYKLNNNFKSYACIIRPDQRCISELDKIFDKSDRVEIINQLSNGYPVVKYLSKSYNTKYIDIVEIVNENSSSMMCKSLISKEYGGLEYYTDKKIGDLSIRYNVDALGRALMGSSGEIVNNNYNSREGITTTISYDIQKICENASSEMNRGCIIVMDCLNSQVLASVSKGSDYINRAVSPYAVGSIFKLAVCCAAIENDLYIKYDCKGSIKIGDTEYHCQKNKSHGKQNMKEALANSCNCYFVNLALKLGKDKLLNFTDKAEFNKKYSLYNNWTINASTFPSAELLKSQGQLALLGFGQGSLTDNPLHFAAFVSSISNGGYYNPPSLDFIQAKNKRIMKTSTALVLRDYMHYVVTNGTGIAANYNNNTAGKTATAQSGIYNNGEEQLNTWFVGFYPYNNPKYTILVMKDGGKSGAEDCCPIFRTIVEKLDKM